MAGLARSAADPDFENSECAVVIREDMRERGLATQLLEALLRAIGVQGVRSAVLVFPADQPQMHALCKELGFTIGPSLRDASQAQAVKRLHQDM